MSTANWACFSSSACTLGHAVRVMMKPVGKLDAGNPRVPFDERGGETDAVLRATALFLDSTKSNFLSD
jgi:hypothetical protein